MHLLIKGYYLGTTPLQPPLLKNPLRAHAH